MDDLNPAQGQPEELEDAGTGEEVAETPVDEASPPSSGGNPAWEPLRGKLDPMLFKSIESDLLEFDKQAQARITSVNQQFAPFKEFVDGGHTPESIRVALDLAKAIDENPVEMHQRLGEFLKQNGKLPETPKELSEVIDDEESDEDPRIAALQQQQEQFKQYVAEQERIRANEEASRQLEAEIATLRKDHPEMTDADEQEVLQRAATLAWQAQQQGKQITPKLEDAYQSLAAYRNAVLSAPRPGESAPKLPPTSGGAPAANQGKKSLGELSSNETVDLLAGLISGGRQA